MGHAECLTVRSLRLAPLCLAQGTADHSLFPGYLASDPGDGAPQLESNGIVSVTLQKMLMQVEGRRILLFPARPLAHPADD